MVDTTGIRYRIGLSEEEVTADIREEFEENQQESWAALRFGGEMPYAVARAQAARLRMSVRACSACEDECALIIQQRQSQCVTFWHLYAESSMSEACH